MVEPVHLDTGARSGSDEAIYLETCATCDAFYPAKSANGKVGQCRRGPPQTIVTAYIVEEIPDKSGRQLMRAAPGSIDGAWPATGSSLSCKCYRRKGTNGASPMTLPDVPVMGDAEIIPLERPTETKE